MIITNHQIENKSFLFSSLVWIYLFLVHIFINSCFKFTMLAVSIFFFLLFSWTSTHFQLNLPDAFPFSNLQFVRFVNTIQNHCICGRDVEFKWSIELNQFEKSKPSQKKGQNHGKKSTQQKKIGFVVFYQLSSKFTTITLHR